VAAVQTWSLLLTFLMLLSCAAQQAPMATITASENTVREEEITRFEALTVASVPVMPALDIGVVLFDSDVEQEDVSSVASVRRLESKLLAGLLRDALVASNQWGAVRLLPSLSPLVPVAIETHIVHSDGRDLILDIWATDALGERWFQQRLIHRQSGGEGSSGDFAQVFNVISNRLLGSWANRSLDERASLLAAADIKYAQQLAPDAFEGYLIHDEERLILSRLPAQDDPMLLRVMRIKNQEYLFCDAIDEQYVVLAERIGPTYEMWRESAVEQAEWLERYQVRVADREANTGDGAFARMQSSYAAYRSYRIQEQALTELAEALDGESRPLVINAVGRAVTLEGTLETQYDSWRQLLKEIYMLEQGEAL
jgi:hypothetical protein